MNKAVAYFILTLFSIGILAASVLIAIYPQAWEEDDFHAAAFPDHSFVGSSWFYLLIAGAIFVLCYGGFFLIIRYRANNYLITQFGYSNFVGLCCALQLVIGILFVVSLFGGRSLHYKNTSGVNMLAGTLLLSPWIIRKLRDLMQPDKSYDNFLERPDNENMD